MKPRVRATRRMRYQRISDDKRKLLLEKIFLENKRINIAAQELKINYSSAKTILHMYRKNFKRAKCVEVPEEKRCQVKICPVAASAEAESHIVRVVTQGGQEMGQVAEKIIPREYMRATGRASDYYVKDDDDEDRRSGISPRSKRIKKKSRTSRLHRMINCPDCGRDLSLSETGSTGTPTERTSEDGWKDVTENDDKLVIQHLEDALLKRTRENEVLRQIIGDMMKEKYEGKPFNAALPESSSPLSFGLCETRFLPSNIQLSHQIIAIPTMVPYPFV